MLIQPSDRFGGAAPVPVLHTPTPIPASPDDEAERLTIGFVNNMPPSAMLTTERQFRLLLEHAAPEAGINLRLFAMPGAAQRAGDGPPEESLYEELDALWTARLDALIVTGAEPRAVAMTDEPYWPVLAQIVDWACANTISTVFSCLAAHAAVYRLDGLNRELLPKKLSGVFTCERADPHPLTAETPEQWRIPHSRFNALDEAALRRAGYTILSRSDRLGPDMFLRQDRSLLVFVQGHPEYDADTLLREYRRDVRRYIAGVWDHYPDMPEHYFDAETEAAMQALREQAIDRDGQEVQHVFDAAMAGRLPHDWHAQAVRILSNWLALVGARRSVFATSSMPA